MVTRHIRACLGLTVLVPGGLSAQRRIDLAPCALPGVEREARCGIHQVLENKAAPAGPRIPVFVAVLPAFEQPAAPDPLFVLAGGPGQAASGMGAFVSQAFRGVRRQRDIVLVDLAGTGRSAALRCSLILTARDVVGDFYPLARVRACRDSLARQVDLRRYTTAVLMDDLDQVRAALGYQRINIYGTSYGSRAALVYLRQHPDRVRSMVLKAVAPPTMRGTMHYARDTERALRYLFDDCAADTACARAFPGLEKEFREILERADREELRAPIPEPAGGPPVELPLSRGVVASTLLGLLQNTNSAAQLPLLIHSTYGGDTRPLVDAIVTYRRGLAAGISLGMHLAVACSEDGTRLDPERAVLEDRETALGDFRVATLAAACREWGIRGVVPPDYAEPVQSDVPVLLVSGVLDPNTNERWGEEALRSLTRGTHVVIRNVAHGFSSIAECGADFMAAFIAQGSANGIDFSCADRVRRPPFVLRRGPVQQGSAASLAITKVTVIDGTGAPAASNQTVLIVADRVRAVGPTGSVSIPAGGRVIDGAGKYLIPGLWDMHVHMEMIGEEAFPLFLANGVTTVRDMGGDVTRLLAWRRAIAEGSVVGPRMRTAGPILESARWLQVINRIQQQQGSPPDEMIAPKRMGVGSPAEAERAIDSLRKLGVDFVKVRTVANPATYFAILRAASRAGLAVVGHSPPVDLAMAADSGQRSIEHSLFPALDSLTDEARSTLFARWAANGTWSVPTLIAGKAFRYTPDSLVLATIADTTNRLEPLRRYASARQLSGWRRDVEMKRAETPMDWAAFRRSAIRDFKAMRVAGVRFVTGTDTPTVLTFPGFALHDELVLLVEELGLSPMEALQAATRNASELLGLGDSVGVIAPGKVADLVLLSADPLANIAHTRRIEAVVAGGKLYDRRALDELLAGVEAASGR